MKTKLIIVEGMDNTGKTTLINRLEKVLSTLSKKVHIIHLEKPPKNIPEEEIITYTKNYYDAVISQLTNSELYNLYDYIIIDRCHLSEYVYAPIYRNRNKLDIVEDNIVYEYKLLKAYKNNIYMFLLYADNCEFLLNHEDGKSLSDGNINNFNIEQKEFEKAFDMSLIKNKYPFCINELNEYKDILPYIFNIIYEE